MKTRFQYVLFLALSTVIISCKKDNYSAPNATLSGRIVYQGVPLSFEYNKVPFEVYQPGFGKTGSITGTFTPEGAFSLLLFNGDYKFVVPNAQVPFAWPRTVPGKPDTVAITLNGNTNLDIEVMPYYIIKSPQFSFASGKVTGTCTLEKIVTGTSGKNLERVTLYISKTTFADSQTNIAVTNLTGTAVTTNVNVNVTVPTINPTQNYVYARIGVKFAGVDQMIFTAPVKVTL